MRRVKVDGVRVERGEPTRDDRHLAPGDRTFVTLRESDGRRVLGIEIGDAEAFAIASALEGKRWRRPMTHELFGQLVIALGATLRQIRITEHRDGVYLAELQLTDRQGDDVVVSARPSDAVAVALRVGAPILVSDVLLTEAA